MTELRALLKLAGPLVVVSAGVQLMSLVDTAVVGRLNPVALAAAGLGNALFFTPSVLGFGIMMGLDPLISQAVGARDLARAQHLLTQGFWLALGVTLVLLPFLWMLPPLLGHVGVPKEVVPPTTVFFRLRLLSLFPTLWLLGGRSYLQAHGSTRPLVLATLFANVVNAAGDYLLVFGGAGLPASWGFLHRVPALGLAGAALCTALSSIAQALWVLQAIRRRGQALLSAPDALALRQAFKVGLPVGLQMAAEYGIFGLSGVLVGRLGAAPLAAHQVALQLASFTFMAASGLAAASSVRVGIHVGARNSQGVRHAGYLSLAITAASMGLFSVLLVLWPRPFAMLLTDQPEVLRLAVPLLTVVAAFQLSDGIQTVAAGLLRGTGETRFSFLANVAGHYLVGLPTGLFLALWLGQGVMGFWWGLALGLTAVALALVVRFHLRSKRTIQPLSAETAPTPSLAV